MAHLRRTPLLAKLALVAGIYLIYLVLFQTGPVQPMPLPPATELQSTTSPATSTVREEVTLAASSSPGQTCTTDLDFLRHSNTTHNIQLSEQVVYARRCIQPVFSNDTDRDSVPELPGPLISHDTIVRTDDDNHGCPTLPSCDPIKLRVPPPYPREAKFPHLAFGAATSYARLQDSLGKFQHCLAGSEATLMITLTDFEMREQTAVDKLEAMFRTNGMRLILVRPQNDTSSVTRLHFTTLGDIVSIVGPEVRWFGILDDDTFFPHLKPLSDALGAFDHSDDMYVGALSEDFGHVQKGEIMGFKCRFHIKSDNRLACLLLTLGKTDGGAGAYVSAPLARKLAAGMDECIREAPGEPDIAGDTLLGHCVYHVSKVKLNVVRGLWQQDLSGDISGFFESGLLPLNLHHCKSWFHEPVVAIATASLLCGDCFLQRFQFGKDTVLSNGYSIATYRQGVSSFDLKDTESKWNAIIEGEWKSMEKNNSNFDFSLGPLRPKLAPKNKKSYKLVDSALEPDMNGQMRQLYVFRGKKEQGDLDEVVELVWGT